MNRYLLISLILLFLFPSICFSQVDREAEARKLYLEASQLVRAEDYTMAEEKLNIILEQYLDTEIALKADELLSSITEKIKQTSLPTTPGYYILLKNGTLIELQKLRRQDNDVMFLQKDVLEIYADEFDKFYVYNPKASLSSVSWVGLAGYKPPEGQEVDRWKLVENFMIPTSQGDITYDKLVFNELKTGLFEIKFPDQFSPTEPFGAALVDGTPYIGVVIVQREMIDALYPLMEYWNSGQVQYASEIITPLLRKYPQKPELNLFAGVIQYKQSHTSISGQEKAKKLAINGLEVAKKDGNVRRDVVNDLEALLWQCRTDSAINAAQESGDTPEQLRSKLSMLEKFDTWGVANANYRWFNAKALLHCMLGEYESALDLCDRSLELFDTYGESGFSFLGTRVTIKSGSEEAPKFTIRKALNNFDEDNEDRSESLKNYIESEQILAQVEKDYIQANGDPEKGLDLVDEAEDKDDHNPHVYLLRATLYEKLGDMEEAKDAREEAEEERVRPKDWK